MSLRSLSLPTSSFWFPSKPLHSEPPTPLRLRFSTPYWWDVPITGVLEPFHSCMQQRKKSGTALAGIRPDVEAFPHTFRNLFRRACGRLCVPLPCSLLTALTSRHRVLLLCFRGKLQHTLHSPLSSNEDRMHHSTRAAYAA